MPPEAAPNRSRDVPPRGYAQWGDDVKVWEFFGRRNDGVFLEAGANDPRVLSQTCFLEERGWTGALVEPMPECCERLRSERPGSRVFQNALGAPEQRGVLKLRVPGDETLLAEAVADAGAVAEGERIVEAELITLDEVLERSGIERLDVLSLDLEGMELQALRGLDLEARGPRLIIVEDRLEHLRTHRYLERAGYRLVLRNGSNDWYLPAGEPFAVPLSMRLRLLRKMYLSMPFRRLRALSRRIRGKAR